MKENTDVIFTQYIDGEFVIEILEYPDTFEAWVYHKDYGVKELMWGCPKVQPNGHDVDREGFLEMVEYNRAEYEEGFLEEYAEDDE